MFLIKNVICVFDVTIDWANLLCFLNSYEVLLEGGRRVNILQEGFLKIAFRLSSPGGLQPCKLKGVWVMHPGKNTWDGLLSTLCASSLRFFFPVLKTFSVGFRPGERGGIWHNNLDAMQWLISVSDKKRRQNTLAKLGGTRVTRILRVLVNSVPAMLSVAVIRDFKKSSKIRLSCSFKKGHRCSF